MNCYERRLKLKSKGIKTLQTSGISTGYDTVNGVKQPLIIFSDREVADRYTRRLQVAGDRNNLASRLWDHNGWFADSIQNETIKPAVCLMGKAVLYGYEQNEMLHFYRGKGEARRYEHDSDSEDSIMGEFRDFARYANSRAERIAEECRDYDEKWHKARELEGKIEELDTERRETLQGARAWVRDCKGAALTLPLCERIRGVVRGARRTAARLLEEITEAREEMKGLPEV